MGFTESRTYPTLQDMLSSYFYPGDEEPEAIADLALRLRADNPDEYVRALRADIARFLRDAGDRADRRFGEEFLSYFVPADRPVGEWLAELGTALLPPPGGAADREPRSP